METIGYHTCSKEGGKYVVEKKCPFFSSHEDKDFGSIPFLGSGYYYWDYQLEVAKEWGRRHYNKNYFVIESKLKLEKPYFFDLVGNMADILHFKNLRQILKELGQECKYFAEIIEVLKELNEEDPGFFNFKAIRALDLSRSGGELIEFVKNSGRNTDLDPVMIICLILPIKDSIIKSKKVIFES